MVVLRAELSGKKSAARMVEKMVALMVERSEHQSAVKLELMKVE